MDCVIESLVGIEHYSIPKLSYFKIIDAGAIDNYGYQYKDGLNVLDEKIIMENLTSYDPDFIMIKLKVRLRY